MRIHVGQDIRPLSEFRAQAAAYIEQIRRTKRPLVLTQRGRGAAVVLDVDEYERLMERCEILEDIREAESQLAAGQGLDHESVRERLREELGR